MTSKSTNPMKMTSFAQFNRPWLDLWMASARLGLESQAVIGLRLFGLATGEVPAHHVGSFVTEKVTALADAQMLVARSAFNGRSNRAAEDVVRLYRRRVRANRRELARQG